MSQRNLHRAINNLEKLIEKLINNPPEDMDHMTVNELVQDYNLIRGAVTEVLRDREQLPAKQE
jgi:hypothetical protein